MDEYNNEINKAIEYLFEKVLTENDVLLVITPDDQWKITMSTEKINNKNELAKEVKRRVAKSIRRSGMAIRLMLTEIRDLAVYDMENADAWRTLKYAEEIIQKIVLHKSLSEEKFEKLASFLKPINAQKQLFIFYGSSGFFMGKPIGYNGSRRAWSHARYRALSARFGD